MGGSPCSPRDSQESSPTPQFKSINSSVLSFLYSPTLTSIHDHWENHSLDQMDLCWQSDVSDFMIETKLNASHKDMLASPSSQSLLFGSGSPGNQPFHISSCRSCHSPLHILCLSPTLHFSHAHSCLLTITHS